MAAKRSDDNNWTTSQNYCKIRQRRLLIISRYEYFREIRGQSEERTRSWCERVLIRSGTRKGV